MEIKFKPYFIGIIGINSPCQISIGIRDLIHKVKVTIFAHSPVLKSRDRGTLYSWSFCSLSS